MNKVYRITLIEGDGIGPEVVKAAKLCVEASGLKVEWEERFLGKTAQEKTGQLIPEETLDSIRRNRVALKGPVTTPVGGGFRSVNVELRKKLDLYANLRPVKSWPVCTSPFKDRKIDIVVVRENTEDLYAGIEFNSEDDFFPSLACELEKRGLDTKKERAISLKVISEENSRRIIRFAFDYAQENKRKKVTCIHKANILKFTDGLFLKIFYEEAKNFPEIISEDYIVDNFCMQVVLRPENFDVLVLPNLYGDIVSDLCAGLVGGLGLAPGANIGKDCAVFEPVHGSAPKHAGKNKVNPIATILSATLMLKYLKQEEKAEKIERAIEEVIKEGEFLTYDLKPTRDDPTSVGTLQMAEAIVDKIKSFK
ncbi:MAG TPA: isocitrate/isopropylmalate dehydrogenase family protein [Candidatus Omnitrophica bacterium]|nr:MAG: hypothetical protein DRP69_01540 [Candidatus Omnitrophota bacterium]RKY43320.1 MAG: hypothetical protein DRP80_05695 [Candidatus Omnitrophota bacterium]HEC69823.1 isocitrate/isopropylmalate dehydrogenase family protein [Candidatus Omnitrophota bacterium]